MLFIKKDPAAKLDAFFTAWDLAHHAIANKQPSLPKALRRHIRSKYLPEGDKVTAYFGPNVTVYEGVSSMWFENEADLSIFREYQRSLLQRLSDEGIAASSESFFIYAKEVVIL